MRDDERYGPEFNFCGKRFFQYVKSVNHLIEAATGGVLLKKIFLKISQY